MVDEKKDLERLHVIVEKIREHQGDMREQVAVLKTKEEYDRNRQNRHVLRTSFWTKTFIVAGVALFGIICLVIGHLV